MKEEIALRELAGIVKRDKWRKIKVLEKKQHAQFYKAGKRAFTLSIAGCFPLVVAPGFFLVALKIFGYPEFGKIVAAVSTSIGLMMLLIGSWVLYTANKSEDRFLFDFRSEELIEFKKKRGEVSRRSVCSFKNFEALVLYPRYSFKQGARGWFFGLSLLTEAGSLLELVSKHENRSRDKAMELGLVLSKLLKVGFHHGDENTVFEYKESPSGLEYGYVTFEPKGQ